MSSQIEKVVENIFQRAEDAARKPLPVVKKKAKLAPAPKPKNDKKDRARWEAMNKAKGVNRPYKPTLEQAREKLKDAVKENIFSKMGKTDSGSIEKAGGDSGIHAALQKKKAAERAKNSAPVHRDEHGRRDLKAGPKGHSAKNTFSKPGKRTSGADNFSKGAKSAPMSKDAINQSGVTGQTVQKDGQKIPSERWSALKGALANRKASKALKSAPDVN